MRHVRLHVLLLLVVFSALSGCHTVGTHVAGIDNFDVVQEGPPKTIYRGAQPSRDGIATLKSKGVATVIDLRKDSVSWEESEVDRAEMHYINIPTQAGKIEPDKIRCFLHTASACTQPVYVHCQAGKDRTGLEIAMYRVVVQNWSRGDAVKELYDHGQNWFWFPKIAPYIREFKMAEYRDCRSATSPTSLPGH
jgi:tyrosine-protein phosphatase SIW14